MFDSEDNNHNCLLRRSFSWCICIISSVDALLRTVAARRQINQDFSITSSRTIIRVFCLNLEYSTILLCDHHQKCILGENESVYKGTYGCKYLIYGLIFTGTTLRMQASEQDGRKHKTRLIAREDIHDNQQQESFNSNHHYHYKAFM